MSDDLQGFDVDDAISSDAAMGKDRERQQLQAEIEAFLARGGKINTVPSHMRADPPRKPESNYGGQPI